LSRLGFAVVRSNQLEAERRRAVEAKAVSKAKIARLLEGRQALLEERETLRKARTDLIQMNQALEQEVRRVQSMSSQDEAKKASGSAWYEHKKAARELELLRTRVETQHADRATLFAEMWSPSPRTGVWPSVRKAAEGPLVLLAAAGPSSLELMKDARIVEPGGWGTGAGTPPDLLVVPQPERDDFEEALAKVPDEVWSWTAEGRTRLVLDGSSEGVPHILSLTRRTYGLAQQRGIDTAEIAYLTQDRLYGAHHRAYCSAEGLSPMQVFVHDYFLHLMLRRLGQNGEELFETRRRAFRRAPRKGRRKFLSLNLTPRSYKVLFLLRLLRDGLWDEGYVSFGGFERLGRSNEMGRRHVLKRMARMEGFADAVEEAAPYLDELDAKGPILFGMDDDASPKKIVKTSYRASGLQEYRRSWFTVVTETGMMDRLHRVTEKTFKPILNLHPFIVLGDPGSLSLVREYGFQTFQGFFDESYDLEPNRRRRFEMVYGEVVRLARMDEAELSRLEARFAEVIQFNARWGLIDLPGIFEEHIGADLLARLMSHRSA
jgi:hypothetical protein